jgi:hypothetical protein
VRRGDGAAESETVSETKTDVVQTNLQTATEVFEAELGVFAGIEEEDELGFFFHQRHDAQVVVVAAIADEHTRRTSARYHGLRAYHGTHAHNIIELAHGSHAKKAIGHPRDEHHHKRTDDQADSEDRQVSSDFTLEKRSTNKERDRKDTPHEDLPSHVCELSPVVLLGPSAPVPHVQPPAHVDREEHQQEAQEHACTVHSLHENMHSGQIIILVYQEQEEEEKKKTKKNTGDICQQE